MAGVYGGITIDVEWWTAESESSVRSSAFGPLRILQPHHTAYPSLSGSRALMDPGGRTVSANGLLDTDGILYGVVPPWRRAFTSASWFDHISFTVECVNSTGAPEWGLTDAQHRRLGQIARELAVMNGRNVGNDMIVQHSAVPDSYPTSCAGPSYNQGLVLAYAVSGTQSNGSDDMDFLLTQEETISDAARPWYLVMLDGNGGTRMRYLDGNTVGRPDYWLLRALLNRTPAMPIVRLFGADLEKFGKEIGYVPGKPNAPLKVTATVEVDIDEQALADGVAKAIKVPTAEQNGAAARAAIVK